jgi:hypothetical protein
MLVFDFEKLARIGKAYNPETNIQTTLEGDDSDGL